MKKIQKGSTDTNVKDHISMKIIDQKATKE